MFKRLKEICKYSIQYACILHCTFEYVADFVVCSGPSMEPTLYSDHILLTERITTRLHSYNRGDIIVAVSPTDPKQFICKRIVGISGDKIIGTGSNSGEVDYVPKGHVWIEGDNKSNSSDSRYYGAIPQGLIVSRVLLRVWPFKHITIL